MQHFLNPNMQTANYRAVARAFPETSILICIPKSVPQKIQESKGV